jgi:hypothetical protein
MGFVWSVLPEQNRIPSSRALAMIREGSALTKLFKYRTVLYFFVARLGFDYRYKEILASVTGSQIPGETLFKTDVGVILTM